MLYKNSETVHPPVFLIGTQRSGTTLLCRMLTAHPDVFIKNELPVRSVFTGGAGRQEIERNISHFVEKQYGLAIPDLLKSEGKCIWGLKDPELTRYLPLLGQCFPEARFIVITRDPRAVVNSYMENRWGLGTNAYTGAQRWRDEVEDQLTFESNTAGKVLRLKYEDLVLNQQATLELVCRFLEVEFDPVMMAYAGQKAFVVHSRENRNTFNAPDPALTRKWRDRLSDHEVRVIESVARSTMARTGYAPELPEYRPPGALVVWYRLHQSVLGEVQIQYRWRVRRWIRELRARLKTLKHSSG